MRWLGGALVLLVGCGGAQADDAQPTATSTATASSSPSGSGMASAGTSPAVPRLTRTTTPEERRRRDEAACDANDIAACRRVAERYRGYGHVAGCGVDRGAAQGPRRAVTAADAEADDELFDRWIRRACDLGDDEACLEGLKASVRMSDRLADACGRGSLATCPLYLWAAGMHPEKAKQIEEGRRGFMTNGYHGKLFGDLYHRDKALGDGELPKAVFDLAQRVCKASGECDDIFMMLDKDGYSAAALAPLRKAAGEDLVRACLDGDCVCGEAARYLEDSDARVAPLAEMGCAAGEPEACFVLGDHRERGAGVEKNQELAFSLYEVACPPVLASDGREDVYSKAACDRLSQLYEEGKSLTQDMDRAFFYSQRACSRPGFERDHAPCVRRALFHGKHRYMDREQYLLTPTEAAAFVFRGPGQSPIDAKECERPSVEASCKAASTAIR